MSENLISYKKKKQRSSSSNTDLFLTLNYQNVINNYKPKKYLQTIQKPKISKASKILFTHLNV